MTDRRFYLLLGLLILALAGAEVVYAMVGPLSEPTQQVHLIKAARYTTKYLIGRLLGGYPREWIFSPTAPYASARTITPHDALV